MADKKNYILNPKDSVTLPYIKIYRSELAVIKEVAKKHSLTMPSYAFWFLCLLSHAVCENVDGENRLSGHLKKPQTYIPLKELKEVLGVPTKKKALEILSTLRDEYKVLDFVALHKYFSSIKIYIHFKRIIDVRSLPSGVYSRQNTNAYKNAMAIKNNYGFFFINKEEFFKIFYLNKKGQKTGVQDYYFLLRLNCVHNAEEFIEEIPAELSNTHIALWKLRFSQNDIDKHNKSNVDLKNIDFDNDEESLEYFLSVDCDDDKKDNFEIVNDDINEKSEIEYCLYLRRKCLTNFLNISDRTVQRYNSMLSQAGLINTVYLPKRGTVITFPLLDVITSEKRNDDNDCNNDDDCENDNHEDSDSENNEKYIDNIEALRNKVRCAKRNAKEITKRIKCIVIDFIKSSNNYTAYNRKYLFLNINTGKLLC